MAEGAGSLVCGDFTIIGDMAEGVAEFTGWEGLVMLTFHEIWVTLFDERDTVIYYGLVASSRCMFALV